MYDRVRIITPVVIALCGVMATITIALVFSSGGFVVALAPIIAIASAVASGYLLREQVAIADQFASIASDVEALRAATQQHIQAHRSARFQPGDLHTQIAGIQAGIAGIQRALAQIVVRSGASDSDVILRELGIVASEGGR